MTTQKSENNHSVANHPELDAIDRQLIDLANKRAEVFQRVVQAAGQTSSLSAWDQQRTRLAELAQQSAGPLSKACIEGLLREVVSGCDSLHVRKRVAFLGPEFSYSYLATMGYFGQQIELLPVATIGAVFDEVNRSQADFGVVPLENSTDGRVADSLTMFVKAPVTICGEVQLPIHHCLLACCKRSEITHVYSKPQALSQCRAWLAKHLPQAKVMEMSSTTAAAQLAAKEPGVAAIASKEAGIQYGLTVVDANIEDNQNNVTRFAIIGQTSTPPTGNDKTALMYEISHSPGALADTMTVFKENGLNMTWIESFPMPATPNEYIFFVEIQGHQEEAKVATALAQLRKQTARLEVLGSFPQSRVEA